MQDEHTSWGKVLRALTDTQTELEKIERSERQRIRTMNAERFIDLAMGGGKQIQER